MENILDMIILITLCVGLTILFIKESDNIKGKSKDDIEKVIGPWGKIMFWGFIISFGLFLFLSNNGFFD